MIWPPAFESDPDPLPGVSVSVPVPASTISPPSLLIAAGASVRFVLLVWNVPPFELSNVPPTLKTIGPVPYWVIVPPWFSRSVAPIRSLGSISLTSGGALTTTNGQIQSGSGAAGDASTLAIQASSIDNTGGLISNLGMGNETVQGGSQTPRKKPWRSSWPMQAVGNIPWHRLRTSCVR